MELFIRDFANNKFSVKVRGKDLLYYKLIQSREFEKAYKGLTVNNIVIYVNNNVLDKNISVIDIELGRLDIEEVDIYVDVPRKYLTTK